MVTLLLTALSGVTLAGLGLTLAIRRPFLLIDHPRTVLVIPALISLAAMCTLIDPHTPGFRMRLDPSEEPMLSESDPGIPPYERAIQNFGDDNLYVVAVQAGDIFTTHRLLELRRISERIRRLPGVRNVESLVNTTSYRYVASSDTIVVNRLVDEIPVALEDLENLRARVMQDPIYRKTMVSADGETVAINVSFKPMSDGKFVERMLDERIRSIVSEELSPPVNYYVTGRQHVKTQAHHVMVRDLSWLIPLAMLVGAVVGWLVTGSIVTGSIPVGVSLLATLWVFGMLAILGRPLNVISLVLGPVLICVGSAYGVHIISRYESLLGEGATVRNAALEAFRYTCLPTIIAGLTTCVGFSSLAISDTPAIRELGLLATVGVAWSSVVSLCCIPALLVTMRAERNDAPGAVSARLGLALQAALCQTARLCERRSRFVTRSWILLAVVALLLLPRIVVDTDYLTFFDSRSRVRRDYEAVSRLLVGAAPIYVVLKGDGEGAFRDPEYLRSLERLQNHVDRMPGVRATLSIVDFIRTLNLAYEKNDPAAERIPDSREEVADLLFLLPRNKIRRLINSNHSSVNLVVRTSASGSSTVRELERRLYRAIDEADLPPTLSVVVTGNTIILNHGADGIARTQFSIVGCAAMAILVLISLVFRSVRTGLLAMIPNLIPVLMFFGVLGAGAAPLSLPTSLLGCIALGIAVDDTAHFLTGYLRRRRLGLLPLPAATDCIRSLGRPIVVSSVMLSAGFLVLTLSGFATLRQLGVLAATTMVICLLADLTLLPALLARGSLNDEAGSDHGFAASAESSRSRSLRSGLASRRST